MTTVQPSTHVFPYYAKLGRDQLIMERHCAQELDTWRNWKRLHNRSGVEGRLKLRASLERAYRALATAFRLASSLDESAA